MTIVLVSIFVPPLAADHQPANVYPVLVTVANVPYVESNVTVFVVGFGVFPPFPSNVIVYVFACQTTLAV